MASEVNDVDSSIVIAGGVTTANFPHVARNFRRSASASFSGELLISAIRAVPFSV